MIVEMVKGQVARDRQAKDGMLTTASAAQALAIEKTGCTPAQVTCVDYDTFIDSYTVLIEERVFEDKGAVAFDETPYKPAGVITFDELGKLPIDMVTNDAIYQWGNWVEGAPPTGESNGEDGA